jgi:signal transduction histidine kinase
VSEVARLLRTNAFRMAALYLALFAASVLALLAFIYFSMAGFIERQTEATIRAEMRGLREQYDQRGLSGLVEVVQARSALPRGNSLYLITDPALEPVVGNLDSWPANRDVRPSWITFVVESPQRNGEIDNVLASISVLPGGFHLLVGRDLRDADAFRRRITTTLGWAALLTLGLGVAGGLFMTRNMLARVEAVNRTSARIIRGDLSQRVPVTGSGDEFDQLAGNLNAMLDQIERLMLGMRQVTDNIAHDLRTPLARLRARLEVTLLERPDLNRYGEALRETIAEADRLLGTFNALLSIAEAESGARRENMAVVDLAAIARSVAELYEPVADEKGLALTLEADQEVAVQGDRHLLSQAVANLLDNALKYTPEGGVTLSVQRVGNLIRLEVADTGPGVPAERRDAVFDRFVRLEGSRSTPGNGLGLSLVRAVAKLHGGEVWLEDNSPGLKAIVTLPVADRPVLPSTRTAA